MLKTAFLAIIGASYGLLAAAGVFTVLIAIGLVPRFAGKTHTARKVFLFEEMVVLGTLTGSFLSIFTRYCQIGAWWQSHFPAYTAFFLLAGRFIQLLFGLFSGMFIGCLALAIAEMLDSIPILTRRISFRHGIGLAILSMAIGKFCGSLLYFWSELHRVVK